MLQVEGKKMSKSLGNFFTVRDLLEQGVPGEVIRFVFLSTHYRKPMDWTEKKRAEAEKTLRKWYDLVATSENHVPSDAVVALLGDDLNTAGVITEGHRLAQAGDADGLRGALAAVGLIGNQVPDWAVAQGVDMSAFEALLSNARTAAMASKNFAEVDRIKSALLDAGVEVQMSKEGVKLTAPSNFDIKQLEALK